MDGTRQPGEKPDQESAGDLLMPAHGTWAALASQLPLPSESQFSDASRVRLYEMNPREWERFISSDPVLAGKVLAVANSAAFGQARSVTSVARAVLLLGYNMLETIMVAYYLEGAIGRWPDYPRAHYEFIRRLCASASICGFHLGRHANMHDPETLGTASLLARLGSLVLGLSVPHPGSSYASLPNEVTRLEFEQKQWKVQSCFLSTLIAQQWGLPRELSELLLNHTRPLVEGCPMSCTNHDALIVCCATVLGAAYTRGHSFREHLELPAYQQLIVNTQTCGIYNALQESIVSAKLLRELQAFSNVN